MQNFTGTDNNWEKVPVLHCPLFKMDRGGKLLSKNFFKHNIPVINGAIAARITGKTLWQEDRMRSLDEINQDLPVQLSLASYMRLSAATVFWDKKKLKHSDGTPSKTLVEFLNTIKRGSKKFRSVLSGGNTSTRESIQKKCITSFVQAAGMVPVPIPVPIPEHILTGLKASNFLSLWNIHILGNRIRDFLYKFYSNRLGIGARVAHFNEIVNEGCTFCLISKTERDFFAFIR
jgi:hypothetical protein